VIARLPASLALLIVGAAITLSGFLAGANWYEYRLADTGDDPWALVNQDGWELMSRQAAANATIWQFRRPRLRLP
jgi:hypothetical protein